MGIGVTKIRSLEGATAIVLDSLHSRPVPGVIQCQAEMQQLLCWKVCIGLLPKIMGLLLHKMYPGDNSILYGHDCNSGCQCGAEHAFRPGCGGLSLPGKVVRVWVQHAEGCRNDGPF